MTDLMPCPHCGGEAVGVYEEIPGGYIVQCHDCCAQVGIMPKERVIAAWNRRAERTCEKLPSITGHTCVVRHKHMEMEFGYWRCSECGAECFEGAKFCMNCGARVIGGAE